MPSVTASDIASALPNTPTTRRQAIADACNDAAIGQSYAGSDVLATIALYSHWWPLTEAAAAFSDSGSTPCAIGSTIQTQKSYITQDNLTQPTSSQRPTFNGGTGADFIQGASQALQNTAALLSGDYCLFVLAAPYSNTSNGAIVKVGDISSGVGIGTGGSTFDNAGNNLIGLNEVVSWVPSSTPVGVANPFVGGFTVVSGVTTTYKNSSSVAAVGGAISPVNLFAVGGYTARYFDGKIYSVIAGSFTPNSTQIGQTERFLRAFHDVAAITYSSGRINVSGSSASNPVTWEQIYQTDLINSWGVVTKLGSSAYKVTAPIDFNGWISDRKVFVEFANNAVPIFLSGSGCTFGDWDAVNKIGSSGCHFLFSARTTDFYDQNPSIFNDGCDCSFNGCEIVVSLSTKRDTQRRLDFSVYPADGWAMASSTSTGILNLRDCKYYVAGNSFSVTHFYQAASSEVINCTFKKGPLATYLFERLSTATFSGIEFDGEPAPGFSTSSTPIVYSNPVFLGSQAYVRIRKSKQNFWNPVLQSGSTDYIQFLQDPVSEAPLGYSTNTEMRQGYTYDLTAKAYLGSGLNSATLAIFDTNGTQDYYVNSNSSGIFSQLNITRWRTTSPGANYPNFTRENLGPHSYALGKYGYQRVNYQYDNPRTESISEIKELQSVSVSLSESAANAIAWIAVNHGSALVTISGSSRNWSDIHDHLQAKAIQNGQMRYPVLLTRTGTSFSSPYSWSIASPIVGTETLILASSQSIALASAGDFSSMSVVIPGSGSAIVANGVTNLVGWTFGLGATINVASGSAIVYVDESQKDNITAGSGVEVRVSPPTLTVLGFQPLSNITISQAGRTLDVLNNASPPYNWQATIDIPGSVSLRVEKTGYETYTQTVALTSLDQTVTVAQIPEGSSDTFDSAQFEFKQLMLADSGFQRILLSASVSLTDEARSCTLAQFENVVVKASWNTLVAYTVPTSLEISAWQGYLTSTGYAAISFANTTGVVS